MLIQSPVLNSVHGPVFPHPASQPLSLLLSSMDDSARRRQPATKPAPSPVASSSWTRQQEGTGDSESDTGADASSRPAGRYDDDDAESSTGGAGCSFFNVGRERAKDGGGGRESAREAFEGYGYEEAEVDSKMTVVGPCPWWRRMAGEYALPLAGEYAAKDGGPGAGCAPALAVADEVPGGSGRAAAEVISNRLFWEACIAHGY